MLRRALRRFFRMLYIYRRSRIYSSPETISYIMQIKLYIAILRSLFVIRLYPSFAGYRNTKRLVAGGQWWLHKDTRQSDQAANARGRRSADAFLPEKLGIQLYRILRWAMIYNPQIQHSCTRSFYPGTSLE